MCISRRTLTLLAVCPLLLLTPAICPAQSGTTDFYGRVVDKNALCAQASGFMSEQDVERLIGEMLAMQGLKNRYIVVGCQSVTNCIATVDKDKRPVILFNPAFLQRVQKLHFSESDLPVIVERDWTTLTILAHELGHHMNNHLTNPLPDATARDKELEADETAGFLLFLMGGSLDQGKPAFSEASEAGSYTHPPRAQRYAALTRGYQEAERRFPRNRKGGTVPTADPVPVKVVSFPSVTIGGQVWMAENLSIDRFRNGDPILHARTKAEWKLANNNQQPAWCYWGFDPDNGDTYGRLYNGYAVTDSRGLAPEGWHLPTDAEWEELIETLGGESLASVKMKSRTGWKNRGNGTNESGFNGRPGGMCFFDGMPLSLGEGSNWWTASEQEPGRAWTRYLQHEKAVVGRSSYSMGVGISVRLLRD